MAFKMDFEIVVKIDPRWGDISGEVEDILQIAARNIETHSKKIVPRKTGATGNSITATRETPLEWRIGPSTEYAPFLEFGTIHMAARPVMVPSAERERPRVKAAVTALVKKLGS